MIQSGQLIETKGSCLYKSLAVRWPVLNVKYSSELECWETPEDSHRANGKHQLIAINRKEAASIYLYDIWSPFGFPFGHNPLRVQLQQGHRQGPKHSSRSTHTPYVQSVQKFVWQDDRCGFFWVKSQNGSNCASH